ncbi:MAG: hypothetical protein H5T97_06820, partial [Firmicutes bacterium]|nr:hypothetical protein [Bacillota bacterium]
MPVGASANGGGVGDRFTGFRPADVLQRRGEEKEGRPEPQDGEGAAAAAAGRITEGAVDEARSYVLALYRYGKISLDDEDAVFRAIVDWLQAEFPDLTYADYSAVAKSILQDMRGYGPIHSL